MRRPLVVFVALAALATGCGLNIGPYFRRGVTGAPVLTEQCVSEVSPRIFFIARPTCEQSCVNVTSGLVSRYDCDEAGDWPKTFRATPAAQPAAPTAAPAAP